MGREGERVESIERIVGVPRKEMMVGNRVGRVYMGSAGSKARKALGSTMLHPPANPAMAPMAVL